jgi:alanine-synthesizing transaminase
MFSSRFKWNLTTNQLARLIEEKKRAGVKLLDLTESNPTRAGLALPNTDWLSALAQPQALHYDPQPRGLLTARAAIADYYQSTGQAVEAERLFLTASTSEAYSWLFKLLADPGAGVLVPQPSYPLFDFLAALEGVVLQPYSLNYLHPHGWQIDFDSLAQAVTPQTRAVILVNPNNPTGSYLKQKEWTQLEAFCLRHHLALIVDEVFRDYALEDDAQRVTSFAAATALTFVLNGFSKVLALPQMKLGWLFPFGAVALRQEAEARLELIADTFLSVNTPVQLAAPVWLGWRAELQQEILTRVRANRDWLAAAVADTACRLLRVEGGWSAILEVPRRQPEEELVLQLLAEENVLVHPGYFFDLAREGFLVLSLLPPPATFRLAVTKILGHLSDSARALALG